MTGRALHGFCVFTALATLFLIFAGGMVTSTRSGLAVPDWPLSYGMLMPPMVGGIFYEHGHRMVAGFVAVLTFALAIVLALKEPRPWVRQLGILSAALVLAQAILGGLTVIFLLPTAISVAHACVAQAFLCLIVTLAVVTSRAWTAAVGRPEDPGPFLTRLATATTAGIYVQLIIGALMRHLAKKGMDHDGPALAIPDFPLAFGRLVPPLAKLQDPGVAAHFAHRVGAVALAVMVGALVWRVWRTTRASELRTVALLMALTLPLQIALGATIIWTGKAAVPTSVHVATGALLLSESLVLTLLCHRRRPAPEPPIPANASVLAA